MNTMYRCAALPLAALLASACIVAPAAAQSRAFNQNALRGAIVFGDDQQLKLNGRITSLTPGARVRDQNNMVVLAATLSGGKFLVNYTLDMGGEQVRDVWILTPAEAAVRPWPTTLQEAQTWAYDATTMTWSKP
jgi:hypothetical protein